MADNNKMAKEKIKEFDDRQRSDHDMLVRLESKVDGLVIDVKDLRQDLLGRIVVLENMHSGIDPQSKFKEFNEYKRVTDRHSMWLKIAGLLLLPVYAQMIGAAFQFLQSINFG